MIKKFKIICLYDYFLSLGLLIFIWPLFLLIYFVIFFEIGSPLFIQKRLGKNKKIFNLFKFRTMKIGTPSLASHKINSSYLTNTGKMLRKFKLDELPQLINVLKGEMSLVGPRPNLTIQKELISERDKYNLYRFKPGITGLSQIKNIDMSNPQLLAKSDYEMMKNINQISYFKYLFRTLIGKGSGDAIIHK
tara:strand:- start:1409 stop:1981 length:573 start_codon:yes stop_codon:yes gene_type:complete